MTLDAFAVCLVVKVSAAVCFRVLKIISQTKMTDFCSFHVHKPLSILGACFWLEKVCAAEMFSERMSSEFNTLLLCMLF